MQGLLSLFTPNATVSRRARLLIVAGWLASLFLVWQFGKIPMLPGPGETITEFGVLYKTGVIRELFVSMWTMAIALWYTTLLSLGFAYLSVVPIIRPVSGFFSAMRFLGLTGLIIAFTMLAPDAAALKVIVLTFGISVFFLRDALRVVKDLPTEEYDHARTFGMKPWRVVWEVCIRGTLDQMFDSIRVNAAMGWMMLTMVEGVVMSQGGIGAALIKMNRHLDLTAILAIQLMILCIGMIQDALIGHVKKIVCPYAALGKEGA